jgi:hypothetical protein
MNQLKTHFIWLCACLLYSATGFAQAGVLEIYGMIKDEASKKKLEGAMVVVIKDGSQFDTYDPGASGKYEISVPLGSVYDFKFSKSGYLTKIVRFDTKNIPSEDLAGGFQTDMDITLFVDKEGFNQDIVKEPFGKASFNSQENSIAFDWDYTEQQMSKIENEFKRLENSSKDDEKKKKDFDALVAAGDKMIGETKYADGIQKYSEALSLFPADAPVKKKKEEAQKKLDELNAGKELEAKYKKAIDDGVANIKSAAYANAKKNFEEAKKLKPSESLPTEKLNEIAELEKNAEAKKKYDLLVAEADKKFDAKDYSNAINKYKEAQVLMPKLTYAGEQIKEAEELLASGQKQKEYDALITQADKDFKSKAYQKAIDSYQSALSIKSGEAYPKTQIDAAKKALGDEEANAKALADKSRYDNLIKEADKLFKEKSYSACIDKYKAAQAILSSEAYPNNQITLAQKAMGDAESAAKEAETKKKYDALIADADKKFGNKDYALSIEKYQDAQALYPSEKHPKDQILKAQTALDAMLASEVDKMKRQKEYDDKIKSAEDNATQKKYDAAINFYKDAQRIKPEESLPSQKIKELQDLIATNKKLEEDNSASTKAANEKAELEKRYQAAITEADALFNKDELQIAKSKYQEALDMKSDAAYPRTKLDRIDQMLADRTKADLANKEKEDFSAAAKAKAEADVAELAKKKADLEAKAKADKEAALRKQQEERDAREHAKKSESGDWTSSADEQAEGELEEYYRNARKLEEQARYKAIEDKKFRNDSLLKAGGRKSEELRAQKLDALSAYNEVNRGYAETGADRNRDKTNELNQSKDEFDSFKQKAAKDGNDLITQNTTKSANQKDELNKLSQKGKETTAKKAEENDKKKKEQAANQQTSQTTSSSRIVLNEEKNQTKKTGQAELKGNDRYQEARSLDMGNRKEQLNEQNQSILDKNQDVRAANIERVDQKKDEAKGLMDKGTSKQQETAERIQEKNEIALQNINDKRNASKELISQRNDAIEAKKQEHSNVADGKDAQREARAQDIEAKKAQVELSTTEQRQKSQLTQLTAAEKIQMKDKGERKSELDYLVVEGTETLPEGVTENSFKLGEKMVTERTVKVGNKIDKYRKVVSKTGTYYFKNGKSITEGTWKQETLKTKRS